MPTPKDQHGKPIVLGTEYAYVAGGHAGTVIGFTPQHRVILDRRGVTLYSFPAILVPANPNA